MAALRPMNVTEFAQAFAKSRENVCADLHPPLLSRKKARYAPKAFPAAGNSLPADAGSGSRSGPRGRILARPPAVVIDGVAGDVRVPLVHAAVAHWNQILAGDREWVSTGIGVNSICVINGAFLSTERRGEG